MHQTRSCIKGGPLNFMMSLAIGMAIFVAVQGCSKRPSSSASGINFSPTHGPIGTLVTITGADFSNTQSVAIGSAAAIPISFSNDSLVALVMPDTSSGVLRVSTSGSAYSTSATFTVTSTGVPTQQQGFKLITANSGANNEGGYSVAISADGNTMLIGNNSQGAAAVFTRNNGTWAQQTSFGYQGLPLQGWSVALSADGNTALIAGNPMSDSGAVVFVRSGGLWTQQGTALIGSGESGSAEQGYSVALSADGNTALIGGAADNSNQGAAWLFARTSGVWTQEGTKLVGDNILSPSIPAIAVAISADGNTVLIGRKYDNNGQTGAAWVFNRSTGQWMNQKLVGSNSANSLQGSSVALSADGNVAIVGSAWAGGWVYTCDDGVWTEQASNLTASDAVGMFEASSVSLSADGTVALLGAPADNNGIGATWVFALVGGNWVQQGPKLIGSGAIGNAGQGFSVALSADGNTAAVGGPLDSSSIGTAWIMTP